MLGLSSDARKKLRTWVALPLVLAYAGSLLFASLPSEFLPRRLARLSAEVRRVQGVFGIYAGYPVFADEDPAADIPLSYCLRVSGQSVGRAKIDVFFPEPECPITGFRWRILPMQRPMFRMMFRIDGEMTAANELLMHDIMRHFCHATYEDGTPIERATLVWWLWSRHYYTLVETRQTLRYLEFDCRTDRFILRLSRPAEAQVIERYGSPPWEP